MASDALINGFDQNELRTAVERVLSSAQMSKAPALASFLKYVVEQALEGKADRLKAYTIAVEALGRPPDFDPQADPIVRMQAGRLRKALALHYGTDGISDPIRIELPSGSYVPRFTRPAAVEQEQEHSARRTLPFAALAAGAAALLAAVLWFFADGRFQQASAPSPLQQSPLPTVRVEFTNSPAKKTWLDPSAYRQALEGALSRFDETVVIVDSNSPATKYRVVARIDRAGNNTARIELQAVSNSDGKVLWSQSYELPPEAPQSYDALDAVNRAASDLAQPYGVILAAERKDPRKTDDIDCILRAFDYFQRPGKEELQHARVCLKWMVTSRPESPVAFALLSIIMLAPYTDGYKPRAPAVYLDALEAARTAVLLAPRSARSRHALMLVLFLSGHSEEALVEGRKAVELNPNDVEVVSDYGCRLIFRDRTAEGLAIIDSTPERTALRPVAHRFCLFLAAYRQQDVQAEESHYVSLKGEPGMLALIATALHEARTGNRVAALSAIDALLAFSPGFAAEPHATLLRRGWTEVVADVVLQGLIKAGLEVRLAAAPASPE